MQDVLQMFGWAGWPGFDTQGEAILITSKNSVNKYLNYLTDSQPLES